MTWQRNRFGPWDCWEAGPYRIMENDGGSFDLFRDRYISTEVFRDFPSLKDAQDFAEENT
jgi:hypothetical protein